MNNFFVYILFVIMLLLFLCFYLLNDKYYNYKKFISYITIISAISTFILAIGIIFQVISYKITETTNIVQSFTSFSKDYLDSIVEIFIEHPEMNYYYLELFHGKINKNSKRNIVLENQINTRIMVKTIEQVSIIDAYNNDHEIAKLKTSLVKIVNTFLKSENFKSYYINIYKERFAGPLIIKFMKENFGI